GHHHFLANVVLGISRLNREISFLVAWLVTEVRALDAARVPTALERIDVVVRLVLVGVEPNLVENEELRLGTKVRGIADSGRLQVRLGLPRNVPGIARVL